MRHYIYVALLWLTFQTILEIDLMRFWHGNKYMLHFTEIYFCYFSYYCLFELPPLTLNTITNLRS